jgi:6-phosphogluconolactonase/glucosamine-6-phosphate isomerase/deaminase
MGKVKDRLSEKKKERGENRSQRRSDRQENRTERQDERAVKKEERRENMKEVATGIFQKAEDVVDTVWQGETDKDKKEREAYNERIYNQELQTTEATKQLVFDWTLYIGLGVCACVALYIMVK